jgi:UV DNA damage endonuclease
LRNATPDRIIELIDENLQALAETLRWNVKNNIPLFRLSSDIIPFGSHEINQVEWWKIFREQFSRMGDFIQENNLRVSMHPGQFTVLNSLNPKVVKNAIAELEYHTRFLDEFGVDHSHKIIIHIGGVFNDKPKSMNRFVENFKRLSENAQKRVIIENDEKSYSVDNVLELAKKLNIPVVFDIFHHDCFPEKQDIPIVDIVKKVRATWKPDDGRPKLHYSDQWPSKPPGAHSQSVDVVNFKKFYQTFAEFGIDVMLEVKNKERSVLALYDEIPELKRAAKI